jgi:dienelactone hydrolase
LLGEFLELDRIDQSERSLQRDRLYRENPAVIRVFRIVRFAIACGFWLGAGSASAGALVEFPNVSDKGPTLAGYLARPDAGLSAVAGGTAVSSPPYAAVVVLHGCGGISSHSIAIADRLGSWGYVALTVDSLGPRGIANACGGSVGASQAFDAYAAFRYLAAQDFVDPKRIAVLGQSMGGIAALYGVDYDIAAQYFAERFRAAIAYYPNCFPASRLTAPTLIVIGDKDDWTPAQNCRGMVAHPQPDSPPVSLTIYPDAHHAFDVVWLQPGRRVLGHWIEYNDAAARDAEAKVHEFFAAHLAPSAAGAPLTR